MTLIYQLIKLNKHRFFANVRNVLATLLTGCVIFSGFALTPAYADDSRQELFPTVPDLETVQVTQRDLDADGKPELAELRGRFYTNTDLVLIYDFQDDMPLSYEWQDVVHFDHATMVVDMNADGKAELVIFFRKEGEKLIALLYDDRNGDRQVSYEILQDKVKITEKDNGKVNTAYPIVRVETLESWWLPDGRAQSNLTFYIDGFIPEQVIDYYPKEVQVELTNDGVTDFIIEVVDSDNDGNLDYQLFRMVQPLLKYYYMFRTLLHVKEGEQVTKPPQGYLFWPFLEHDPKFPLSYLETPPTINVDWQLAKITRAGVRGYPIESGWHLVDYFPLEKDSLNDVNYENPMAYYDLAQNQDGYPELHVRVEYHTPFGPEIYKTSYGEANEDIRYSWKVVPEKNLSWDFKLGLAGKYPIQDVVNFPDFAVRTIPYENLPGWVVEREWDFAFFIAREGREFSSSEGIYFGKPYNSSTRPYFLGESAVLPEVNNDFIEIGWRGEYNFDMHQQAILYLSAIDGKLHLKTAQDGLWRFSNPQNTEIVYQNLGGKFINLWQLFETNQHLADLYAPGDYLLLNSLQDGTLQIKTFQDSPSVLEILPPVDHTSWDEFGKMLASHQPTFTPQDFQAMFDQFTGPVMTLSSASMRDFRLIPNGFRFILTLNSGFQITGEDWFHLEGVEPGSYLVTYDGKFSLQSLIPATLVLEPSSLPAEEPPPTQYIQSVSRFLITNQGLDDAPKINLHAQLISPQGEEIELPDTEISLKAGEKRYVYLPWIPDAPGSWRMVAEATLNSDIPQETFSAKAEQLMDVLPAEGANLPAELGAFGLIAPWQGLLLLLLVATTGGLVGWIYLRQEIPESSTEDKSSKEG